MTDLNAIELAAKQALLFDSEWDAFLDRAGGPTAILALVEAARRYRWLREQGVCAFAETDAAWGSPEALDAAIDKSMRFEKA